MLEAYMKGIYIMLEGRTLEIRKIYDIRSTFFSIFKDGAAAVANDLAKLRPELPEPLLSIVLSILFSRSSKARVLTSPWDLLKNEVC